MSENDGVTVMYDVLCSSMRSAPVDLGSIPARAAGFNRVMTLSKLCTYTCALANQVIHPLGVVNWYRQFVGGNSALRSFGCGEIGD